VLGALWIRSLGRALVRVDTSTQSSAVHGARLPFARSGIRGTVAGRYLIYQRRDPGSFVRWCIVAVVMGAAAVSTIRTPHYHVALILSAVLGAWILGVYNANSIGLTGPAFGLEASALSGARALRAYLAGRGIALAIIAVPLMTAASFAIAAVAGHPADGFWVVAIDLAGIGAGLALSSIFTVTLAYPAEKRPGNPMPRAADGYGGRVFAGTFGSLAGVLLATVPVILAVEFTNAVPAAVRIPVLVVGAAGYGLALAWAAAWIAARAAAQRLPELYQLAVRSKL
jgi:ABC-2 type transport system permease protein